MKIRTGFVSNSSSSSFIIIGNDVSNDLVNTIKAQLSYNKNSIKLDDKGHTKFGWEHREYTTFWDRLNFTMIQIMSESQRQANTLAERSNIKFDMLREVLKDVLAVDKIENKLSLEYDCRKSEFYSYIDHQSCITEGENGQMFKDEETLKKFLFSEDSYIQGGNDNE